MNNVSATKRHSRSLSNVLVSIYALSSVFWLAIAASGQEACLGLLLIGALSFSIVGILMSCRGAGEAAALSLETGQRLSPDEPRMARSIPVALSSDDGPDVRSGLRACRAGPVHVPVLGKRLVSG